MTNRGTKVVQHNPSFSVSIRACSERNGSVGGETNLKCIHCGELGVYTGFDTNMWRYGVHPQHHYSLDQGGYTSSLKKIRKNRY